MVTLPSRDGPSAEARVKSPRLILCAVGSTLFLAAMGQTIVAPALPTIVGDLGGLDQLTWVVTAFLLSSTVVVPIYGKLGDLFGRKSALQAAILLFMAGSALSALATSMTLLIVARIIQGLGGGGLMVVATAVVAEVVSPRQRGRIQGLFGALYGIATVLGPLLGGFIVEHLSWRWIFLVNLPLGMVALAIIGIALNTRRGRIARNIDYLGFVLLGAALSSFVLATSLGGTIFPWDSALIIDLIVVSALLVPLFVIHEARAREPVLPLSLFRDNTFVIFNGVAFLVNMTMFGSITFVLVFLQTGRGLDPTDSVVQLIPMVVGILGTLILSGQIISRTGRYRLLPILCTAVLFVALLLLSRIDLETPTWKVILYTFLFGVGIGPVNSVSMTAIQNAAPREMVGVATAGATLFRQIGAAVGVSISGAIFSSSLAAQLGGGVAGTAMNARDMSALPEAVRSHLLEGMVAALHPVFLTASGVALLAFILSFFLRELPLANTVESEPRIEPSGSGDASVCVLNAPAGPAR